MIHVNDRIAVDGRPYRVVGIYRSEPVARKVTRGHKGERAFWTYDVLRGVYLVLVPHAIQTAPRPADADMSEARR